MLALRKLIIACILLSAISPERIHAQGSGYILQVRDKDSGQPLAGASIFFPASNITLISDSLGYIIVPSIIKKNESIHISMAGFKKSVVSAKQTPEQQIELELDVVNLEEVIITNHAAYSKVRSVQMGSEVVTALEAKNLPSILGEVDIIKILQLKTGVKNAGEGLAGFYVRGGGADQNLIMLDGIPVYNPNHLLGVFSIFNNDAIRDVKLFKSAYPARYGGRLSSVLDVSSRVGSSDSFMISGGVGLLSSRVSLESPITKGKSSFIISGRRTYSDVFTRALNRANEGKENYERIPAYFFSDINVRSDWKINSRNTFWATAYLGADNFSSEMDDYSSKFTWGNQTASVNWKSVRKAKTAITGSLFYSGYKYRLGNRYDFNNVEIRSSINTTGVRLTADDIKTKAFTWQGGISAMKHTLKIGDFISSSQLSSFTSGEKAYGNEGAIYVNAEWDNDKRFAFLGGLRISAFDAGKKWYINPEPRFLVKLNIGEHAALKGSYTRMFQYLHLASLSSASLPVDMWYPSTNRTLPQYSDQFSIGLSKAVNNIFFMNIEGYYKWMYNQVEFRDGADLIGNPKLENDFIYGKGNAYGVETYLEKKSGRTRGWVGYTLAWATRTFAAINDGSPFKPRYDRRHDVSVVFMHKINETFSVSGSWVYGSGAYTTVPVGRYVFQNESGRQPRSIIPIYANRNNYQLAPVHRLDLNLVISLRRKSGHQDITFSLYNAYSRRNPFYIQFREVDDKEGYITAIQPTVVSLFPLLPGLTYNFKF